MGCTRGLTLSPYQAFPPRLATVHTRKEARNGTEKAKGHWLPRSPAWLSRPHRPRLPSTRAAALRRLRRRELRPLGLDYGDAAIGIGIGTALRRRSGTGPGGAAPERLPRRGRCGNALGEQGERRCRPDLHRLLPEVGTAAAEPSVVADFLLPRSSVERAEASPFVESALTSKASRLD